MFGQRVIERNRAAADMAEALGQPGSFRMLIAITSDSHPVNERRRTNTLSAYAFGQRVMERNRTVADVAEALSQLGSFRMLIAINSDSHRVNERRLISQTTGRRHQQTTPVAVKIYPPNVCQ